MGPMQMLTTVEEAQEEEVCEEEDLVLEPLQEEMLASSVDKRVIFQENVLINQLGVEVDMEVVVAASNVMRKVTWPRIALTKQIMMEDLAVEELEDEVVLLVANATSVKVKVTSPRNALMILPAVAPTNDNVEMMEDLIVAEEIM